VSRRTGQSAERNCETLDQANQQPRETFGVRKHQRMAGIDAADRRTGHQRQHLALNNRQDRICPGALRYRPGARCRTVRRRCPVQHRRRRCSAASTLPLQPPPHRDRNREIKFYRHLLGHRCQTLLVDERRPNSVRRRIVLCAGSYNLGKPPSVRQHHAGIPSTRSRASASPTNPATN
jgi:hypothetical protein